MDWAESMAKIKQEIVYDMKNLMSLEKTASNVTLREILSSGNFFLKPEVYRPLLTEHLKTFALGLTIADFWHQERTYINEVQVSAPDGCKHDSRGPERNRVCEYQVSA